jgi:acyl-CoA thioester hydrolase
MMEQNQFRHCMGLRIRHYEVDWQGIVHNVNYLLYFELGRVEYFLAIGFPFDLPGVNRDSKIVLVRNEIDYRTSATLNDALEVRTRVREIRNTSFIMEGLITRASDGQVVSVNVAYHVWLDPQTNRPQLVPEKFRAFVETYEGRSAPLAEGKD